MTLGFGLQFSLPLTNTIKKLWISKKKISHRKWITTWPVLTEVAHLLIKRKCKVGPQKMMELYELGGFELFNFKREHITRIKTLMQKYNNLPMDLADASLVVLADEMNIGDILSVDFSHFKTYRWGANKRFNNLFDT